MIRLSSTQILQNKVENIKESLDAFLNADDTLHGDTMLIYGDIYDDVKFLSAVQFTTRVKNPQEYIEKIIYYPFIHIATTIFIGYGLDCSNVTDVVHIGFTASILDAIQKMGRCGRKIDKKSFQTI